MTKLIKTTDLPSTLDALELMEVRGGERKDDTGTTNYCIIVSNATKNVCPSGGAVVYCTVPGSGVIQPSK